MHVKNKCHNTALRRKSLKKASSGSELLLMFLQNQFEIQKVISRNFPQTRSIVLFDLTFPLMQFPCIYAKENLEKSFSTIFHFIKSSALLENRFCRNNNKKIH